MRNFVLNRIIDDSGISGTGVVAEGTIFENGMTVLHWLGSVSSLIIYASVEEMTQIHGHKGHTKVEFLS
jgi:hypothetical protein